MPDDRRHITARIVPLRDRDAGEARAGGTVAERINLVATLSDAQWSLTRRPRPTYTRESIPIVCTPLRAPPIPD